MTERVISPVSQEDLVSSHIGFLGLTEPSTGANSAAVAWIKVVCSLEALTCETEIFAYKE